jgi:hypothetical protein
MFFLISSTPSPPLPIIKPGLAVSIIIFNLLAKIEAFFYHKTP